VVGLYDDTVDIQVTARRRQDISSQGKRGLELDDVSEDLPTEIGPDKGLGCDVQRVVPPVGFRTSLFWHESCWRDFVLLVTRQRYQDLSALRDDMKQRRSTHPKVEWSAD
jgi:hypothetical protein